MPDIENTPTGLDNDPEILAERKKNILSALRLERAVNTGKAVGSLIHAFKYEAASLVSGAGVIVFGYFRIKKEIIVGHRETQAMKPISFTEVGDNLRAHGYVDPKDRNLLRSSDSSGSTGTLAQIMGPTNPIGLADFPQDKGTYALAALVVVFAWTSIMAYLRKRRKDS